MYEKELKALQRAGRFRERKIFESSLKDFASNDYLGISCRKDLLKRAYEKVLSYPSNAAKASQLINGYTPIHKEFEELLIKLNGFEDAILVGSGFLANLALIEALPRKRDKLFLDEEFHASGILASRLIENVEFFRHNDALDLKERLKRGGFQRALIAVEGIYSMSGDLLNPEIFDVADEFGALLIVDEAHSSGVLGKRLLGVFDLFDKEIKTNYIKIGTLGKALGSYGAYILASSNIVSFLENRAKSIIYTTALSLMDVALAMEGLKEIANNLDYYKEEIDKRRAVIKEAGFESHSLIVDIAKKDVIKAQEALKKEGCLVGAIRPPTVKVPILRIIARLEYSANDLKNLLQKAKDV